MFTAYLRDITERRRAEEERDRLLELERIARVDATQARDQLAAILSGVADGVVARVARRRADLRQRGRGRDVRLRRPRRT